MMRRRKWIIGWTILGVVAALLISFLMRPVYEATATVELNKDQNESVGLNFGGLGDQSMGLLGGADLTTDLSTETQVFKSDSLALSVIRQLNLTSEKPFIKPDHTPFEPDSGGQFAPEARSWLVKVFESNLSVSPVEGTRLIRVTYNSRNPKRAADIANGLVDSYRKQYLQSHYQAVSQASDWMTKQLADLKANVESSEKRLTDFEKSSGILTLPNLNASANNGQSEAGGEIYSPTIQKLQDLNSQLAIAESNRVEKEAVYRLAQSGNPEVIIGLISSSLGQGSSAVTGGDVANLQQLEMNQSDLNVRRAQAMEVYGPNNRHLKDLKIQADVLNGQIRDAIQKIVQSAAADLQVARQLEDSLRARFDEQREAAEQLNDKNVQLAVLSQEASSQKELYEDLYTKLQEADVSAGIKATNITLIDPARAPWLPVRPRKVLYVVLGLLVGVFLGLGFAFFAESIDRTVLRMSDIEEITGSPVLGVIPQFEDPAHMRLSRGEKRTHRAWARKEDREAASNESLAWVLRHPTSPASEAFRALRTSVFLSRPGGAPKTILVTSSVPAEGKTTVSSNLAIAIAQHGKKVILVDADLRRPKIKDIFNVRNDIGLSSVLAGAAALDEAIVRRVNIETLDILPAGPPPPMPSELLDSPTFYGLLDELRSRYDMVLIDTPPALILSDAVSIASAADSVLWIVRAGAASKPYLKRAAQLIRRGRLAFTGFLLNGVDSKADPYDYGYGYSYREYYDYYGAYNETRS